MRYIKLKECLVHDGETFAKGTILKVSNSFAQDLISSSKATGMTEEDADAELFTDKDDIVNQAVAAIKGAIKSGEFDKPGGSKHVPGIITKIHDRSDDDPTDGFKNIGEFALAIKEWNTSHDGRLQRITEKAASGMPEGVDSDGGFAVPIEYRSEILKNAYDQSMVAGRCRAIPMTTKTVKIPAFVESTRANGVVYGGISVAWGAEASQTSGSKPKVGQIELNLKKVAGLYYDTEELAQDAPTTFAAVVTDGFATAIARAIDRAVIRGTGAGQPLGILNAPCKVSVDKEAGQAADTIVWENISKMWARLYGPSWPMSVWFINQECMPQLDSMGITVGVGGIPVYMPANGAAGTPYSTLKGRPVIPVEMCSALGDAGDIILADMSQYLLAQHVDGPQLQQSIHIRFDYGETAYRITLRADGQPWWASTLTPENGSATQSPFVILANRA